MKVQIRDLLPEILILGSVYNNIACTMLITKSRDNNKLVRVLVYTVVIVLSVLALIYLDTGNRPPTSIKVKLFFYLSHLETYVTRQ